MPKISVIIPAYQHADTITACIDSVLNQTFTDIEIIVVDDGSTDATANRLRPYLGRIRYVRTENAGAPAARNAGFRLSAGMFVIFCDADIIMRPDMLATLHDALRAHPDAAYAYSGFRFGWGRMRPISFDPERLRRMNFIHTSSLIRRESFPGFDESLKKFQDWDLWLTILQGGGVGVVVPEFLFTAKPRRDGMSYWVPRIFYSPLFEAFGVTLRTVARYREAAEVIARKHGLPPSGREVHDAHSLWFAFLAVFILSAVSFSFPALGTAASLLLLGFTLIGSLQRLLLGACVILAELIFGSLGGMTLAVDLGFVVPLRILLFVTVAAVWLFRIARRRIRPPDRTLLLGVGFVLLATGWGIVNGIRNGIPWHEVFFDANAYFAAPLILFFASAVENETDQKVLRIVLRNGIFALSVFTLLALFFFSHVFPNATASYAYQWLRDLRIAEMTALPGGVYRIFIQSHLFVLLGLLIALLRDPDRTWKFGALYAFTLIAGSSRSFALGLIAAALVAAAEAVRRKQMRSLGTFALRSITVVAVGLIAFLIVLKFPFPESRSQESFQEMLRSRSVSSRDAATASRWTLLPKLHEQIAASPQLGSGFGTTVTYRSADPRIISTTGGEYTTSAFEWGYHDILVDMGFAGIAAYAMLISAIVMLILRAPAPERRWLLPALAALLVIHTVSPYLNHPIGFGYLALLVALAQRKTEEPVPQREPVRVLGNMLAPAPGVIASDRV